MNIRVIEVAVDSNEGGEGVLEITMALLSKLDSDNIRDNIRIIKVDLWSDGVKQNVDVDLNQVYSVISAAIREAGLNAMFNEEEGGF